MSNEVAVQGLLACAQQAKIETDGVKTTPRLRVTFWVATLLFSPTTPLAAQSVLLGEYEGKAYPVKLARDRLPFVEVGGKTVGANPKRLGLAKVDEYLPVFISIRGLKVNSFHLNTGGSQINNEFHFQARFETAYKLSNVFLVLELNHDKEGKQLFLQEVGDLDPRETKSLRIIVPLQFSVGKGHFKIHLFSNGAEVLHSEMPEEYREKAVDRMIAKRIATLQSAEPAPFVGPAPEYPASLAKAKTKGQAVITLQIGPNGRVHDPAVKSATDPAFGIAALEAVKQWRFFPRVGQGHAVESQIEMPFDFSPPSQTEG